MSELHSRQDDTKGDKRNPQPTFTPGSTVRWKQRFLETCLHMEGVRCMPLLSELTTGDSDMTVVATHFRSAWERAAEVLRAAGNSPEVVRLLVTSNHTLELGGHALELVEVEVKTPSGINHEKIYASMLELSRP